MTQEELDEYTIYITMAQELIDRDYPLPTYNVEELAEILKRKYNDKTNIQPRVD